MTLEELLQAAERKLMSVTLIGTPGGKWSCGVRAPRWQEIPTAHGDSAVEAMTSALKKALRHEEDLV